MANAKMKIILPLVVWIWLHTTTAQSFGGIGFGIKREVFFLNLEDGYFGCQVNESTDVLQLFELSKLCDGVPNCFLGSDELAKELKCTNDCRKDDGTECQNGACLDNQCHCNDGYGGCSCEVPDENECKYRPCDVFAHCTNTLGSFSCTCFPGYHGDGFHCEDINECEDPAVAARCVENAECCNLPAHFLCKCNPGFEGDGEVQCHDIDECKNPNICGQNALCQNTHGNYTCVCPEGFAGNPYDGCIDVNECDHPNACGPGALCSNVIGGRQCHCPPGFEGDPYTTGCGDMDECSRNNPCGRSAICTNMEGSFKCACPPGFIGDPMHECTEAECNSDLECSNEKACINFQCIDPCTLRGACGLNALCKTVMHRPRCSCPECHVGSASTACNPDPKCLTTHPRPAVSTLCKLDSDCSASLACNSASGECYDPCKNPAFKCRGNKKCEVHYHRATCVCKNGFIVNERGEIACAPENVECKVNDECPSNKACIDGRCQNPCTSSTKSPCPPEKGCDVLNHKPVCICLKNCSPSLSICLRDNGCPSNQACRAFRCEDPCLTAGCPENTPCTVEEHKPICKFCPPGFIPDAKYGCLKDIICRSHSECTTDQACIGGKCQNPCAVSNPCTVSQDCQVQDHNPVCVKVCQCQQDSDCGNVNLACDGCQCVIQARIPGCQHCPPGVPCDPVTGACQKEPPNERAPKPCKSDMDCLESEACYLSLCQDPCEFTSACANSSKCQVKMHRPICTCPMGYEGNPAVKCSKTPTMMCTTNDDCPITEACIDRACQRPCDVRNPCTQHAVCINTNHGSDCSCEEGFQGNAYTGCVPVIDYKPICQYNEDCPPNKLCDRLNRICINPCFEDSCGDNAECIPKNHGIDCRCLPGFEGNPYTSCDGVLGCRDDNECPSSEACINGQCASPCQCGYNAICEVIYHRPTCKCPPGYQGQPEIGCEPPINPCEPNPCGTNALCELDNGNPICYCPKGLTGNPFKNCIPEGDECSPNPCGPNSGCRVVGGRAICFCLPEFEGKPPQIPCDLPVNPCNPSPCGPNTQCAILSNGYAKCTCLSGFIESPNTIRGCVEAKKPCDPNPCGHGALCDPLRQPVCYCPTGTIGNPFRSCAEPAVTPLCSPGPCGINADCYVSANQEQCYCRPGFIGNPYSGCRVEPSSPCVPNPCGPGAQCVVTPDGNSMCRCPDGMGGDPTGPAGCQGYECVTDDNCADHEACIGYRCRDPCPGSCGVNADCRVEKHHPVCTCHPGLTGNPVIRCHQVPTYLPPHDPCMPNPCGLNTICQVIHDRAVCSCLPDFEGDPQTGCHPECVLNSDCPINKACIDRHCRDPCTIENLCGLHAICQVRDHTATCVCPDGWMGDPFFQCSITPTVVIPTYPNATKPCAPSPCGDMDCNVYGSGVAICDPCLGPDAPYNPQCRPECLTNADCPFNKACLGSKCADPCPGSCGVAAECMVVSHTPVCSCPQGLVGNPFEHCAVPARPEEKTDTCENVQCGANADCRQQNHALACVCRKGFFGNPWIACRPECVINPDCPLNKACINNKCVDPCAGVCGVGAQCDVINHIPICNCPPQHTGDPFVSCYKLVIPAPPQVIPPVNPCDPSPCGPFSRCLVSHSGYATCSCLPNYHGAPPACKPECIVSSECPQTQACVNQKCIDPCPGTCGIDAICTTINHNPICSCLPGHQGDPFVRCYVPAIEEPRIPDLPVNPCSPSPCGPNSICQVKENRPVCSCVANYIGTPPYCRPECVINQECPKNKACIKEKCVDPCIGTCGSNAKCDVVNHTPYCSCLNGFEGDAFIGCSKIIVIETPKDPCNPSPCGPNAQCTVNNGAARCTCIPPYIGNPYAGGCRPECSMNSDCPSHLACLSQHCRDPCVGLCGIHAECTVVNHVPVCTCARGLIGDPFTACREAPKPVAPVNPCEPSPCGPNSVCRVRNDQAICSCQVGYFGQPPSCRPECVVSSECSLDKACINQKCQDPCPGTCGINARCQVNNHNPICSCPPDHVGDPFVQCTVPIKPEPEPVTPCIPSPCGSNAECRAVGDRSVCSCLPGMFGAPPNCRPECVIDQDCPLNLACTNNRCKDPCRGSCGFNAQCTAVNHRPVCSCLSGFEGDPFSGCNPIPVIPIEKPAEPCNPSPCGANAICREQNGAGSCTCLPDYFGDPYSGCRPECVMNSECPRNRACVNNKCKDPCPGTCGINADCRVNNHIPTCLCLPGFTGDALRSCHPIPIQEPNIIEEPVDPCLPSPCGPYSQCRQINGHAVCSCQANYIGAPPTCRPECTVSTDCAQDKACINQKCKDPCPGTCGINARCNVINHNPICSCPAGLVGDPFIRCIQEEKRPEPQPSGNPCVPSPCGPNSQCRVVGTQAACSCLPNYIGRSPNCRPECTINAECPGNLACINEMCKDPCPGSCGANTNCIVIKHSPNCQCLGGFTGDPFSGCSVIPIAPVEERRMPCNPSPCGANAVCKELNGAGSCTCLPEYFGDPYTSCRPECVTNTDCPRDKACVNQKCKDPCPGACGINAECTVPNHAPQCFCLQGYTGNPTVACHLPPPIVEKPRIEPCNPSPCGPYSNCRVINDHAVCSCQLNYIGSPPMCRPECIISADCPLDKACISQKCQDPCPGTCGINARCQVVNHNPICSCSPGFTGDPFVRCLVEEKRPEPVAPINPCDPSPCGLNSQCRVVGNTPACSCLPNYVGRSPNCRPECMINSECASNLACQNERCVDPCPGSCGRNADCLVINHRSVCSCIVGFTGDPFAGCNLIPIIQPVEEDLNPCNPSPCGANAICKELNGAGSCTCLPEYFGDPYTSCRPECVTNSDCPRDKACVNNKCKDPCPGTCGVNAECTVSNHAPSCTCLPGYIGNPLSSCRLPPPPEEEPKRNPCQPSPCGPYSQCRVVNDHAVCSCQSNYIGTPPGCKPECSVSSECAQNKACINNKCQDPCPGTCGINARCNVINHNPICSCPQNYVGDPFVRCIVEEKKPIEPSGNPCVPSPCGPNSQCRVVGTQAACSCSPNYIGRAPNCRPECTINAECPGNLACQNEKCIDPCPGSCGSFTTCIVIKHAPNCQCLGGYTGDPFTGCSIIPPTPVTEEPRNPCNPSPCGANAICKERNGAGSCACLPEYFGDPYMGCRPECVTNSDCDRSRACSNNKCIDPCPGTCGLNAECRVVNHAPSCLCISGYTGDPTKICHVIQAIVEEPKTPVNPCAPSPCGPYSQCREINSHAVCSCNVGYIGSPPMCRPECVVSSECPQDKACVNQKCADPCPGTCGIAAQCKVVSHNPICTCQNGFTGDPFIRCTKIELPPPPKEIGNPCIPSPCGPNSQCRVIGTQAACSCLPNFVGRAPNCRPECTNDSECPNHLACKNEKCRDPCPGSCGLNAQCTVVNHRPVCSCFPGYTGNPSTSCSLPPPPSTERTPTSPCFPSPCGPNAECREKNGAGACICPPGYLGDPYDSNKGCHRECEINSDCAPILACVAYKCVDPCPGTCGQLAECHVNNHVPTCTCLPGFTGDPFFQCKEIPPPPPRKPEDPCNPSPCGPNSQCRNVNGQGVCSCLPNFIGSPPTCRPECVVSSECPLDRACVNQKCADPCPNTCGLGAQCTTKNHNPICACPPGFTGDPFTRCSPQPVVEEPPQTERPPSCYPSPCGPNSQCQIVGNVPSCSCLPNFVGAPPSCRPECVLSSECASQLACINQKCKDPCPGSCGTNANCHVLNHLPICTCLEGYTGDPFTQCTLKPVVTEPPPPTDPCNPSPCGPNAQCRDGICTCLPEYLGNPYESCRPECVLSTECSRDKACIRNKCVDPCPGTCGQNARCDVINHIPTCSCPNDYTGDPFTLCRIAEQPKIPENRDPCNPTPCGPNSQCKDVNSHAVCSCLQGFQGSPPSCKPECIVSAECPQNRACVNQKCSDPCLGSCGLRARCEVRNHSPICSCLEGQTGDPFQSCSPIPPEPSTPRPIEDPCQPSPCGPNSQCRRVGDTPSCSCIQGYIGTPPSCRPECVINPDCPSEQACINNKCRDPCPGSCGDNAECRVISHTVSCTCAPGFTGNAFVQCVPQPKEVINPCEPSPCGANAECKQRNGAGACSCIQDYFGNPYEGCRPECVLSSDCPTNKACIRNKCADPCPGVCGSNAECSVINHVPTCNCIQGFTGNPFTSCGPIPAPPEPTVDQDPCQPSPCGPNSQCREVNGQAVCSCLPEYQGSPPNCKPECVVSSECPSNRACHKFKCANPCSGTCGVGARCEVINHNPICSCPEGLTGDPFTRCYTLPPPPVPQPRPNIDPCNPSPCGPNAQCRAVGDQPSCSCLPNYIGQAPNCRPECVVNTDCPSTQACISEKCRDPCPGSCGFNAECRVQNHIPICTCIAGFTGNAFTSCNPIPPPPKVDVPKDPCNPSPCGQNARCDNGLCSCLPLYHGDPFVGCRPECTMNTDCSPNKSCSNLRCIDPCPGTCGQGAICDVVNHIPTCSCPKGTEGDPFTSCRTVPKIIEPPINPCQPSPCGPNSQCRINNGVAVCSCQTGNIGSPPNCRPECVVSAECPLTQACLNNKCRDPCPGTCGINAQCQVLNHNPICSCTQGNTGDPFTRCYQLPKEEPRPVNPCQPSPCGPNSVCQVRGESPACSCLENYVGQPPNCRPECTINPECQTTRACINQKCRDPCPGSCGSNALCNVVNHNPVCTCLPGMTGDPFRGCIIIPAPPPPQPEPRDPCYPSPCGPNANCRVENTYAVCECLPEYHGNPYEGCRPECLSNSDCPMNRACIRNKCQDPCPGTCGVNALCTVTNHVPICSCPDRFTGDAFRICTPVIEEPPRDPCNPSPCGINTICRQSGQNAICECLPGFFGSPHAGGCKPECTISADCPRDKACVNTKCVDPCPGVCGFAAVCNVINHSPVCTCPTPLTGDPFTLCKEEPKPVEDPCNPTPCKLNGQCRVVNGNAVCIYPECIINQDCPRDKACYNQKCRDPCRDACGLNALCQVVNHNAICSCPTGYIGSPQVQCTLQPIEEPKPKVECTTDSECTNDKACINNLCVNPCAANPTLCGQNAECRVQLHRAVCTCRDGYTGNAQQACFEIGCRADSDCPPIQACINRECVDPCSFTSCGINALCTADSNHKARCYCPENFRGNALIRCERPECTKDDECSYNLACRNERCEDPCNCGLGAICTVTNHRPQCSCPPGYIGNPISACNIQPVEEEPECRMDADCPSKLACFSNTCKNPCVETKPCGKNAECIVIDSLPLRTMSCMCLPGYVGDADTECKQAPQEEPGCKSNDDCPLSQTCLNRKCVNPCSVGNPCASTAECEATDHKAVCKCPAGLVGNPFIRCYEEIKTKVECRSDSECSNDKSCINQRCQDPCILSNPCGTNAECRTNIHRPTCHCPDNWVGNPQVMCYKPECKSDPDCPYNKACINENCLNPCSTKSCGRGAECLVQNHRAQCQCPAGTQGDPLFSCITGICHYNEDCADHEACDRLNRVCRPVCDDETCAETANCVGRNHQPKCSCPIGTTGNPFVECLSFKQPTPECKSDSDCPTKYVCTNDRCEDPCASSDICTVDQECSVRDTQPLKTVMCMCPPDTIADPSGRCTPITFEKPGCRIDSDCNDRDKCIRGGCIEACRIDRCGVNAICNSAHHQAICTCAPGYIGNPHIECTNIPKTPIVPVVPECYSDDDCTYDKRCKNEICVNPCTADKPCATGAFCSVTRHEPICRCPSGYEGNPKIECIAPTGTTLGCTSNSECPKSESCINRLCTSPCNCGPNAECKVVNHYPTCYCQPGYSGNPQIGCTKLGCQSDNECSNDKQCYNGQCINPCIINDPCARNAECFGNNHVSNCRCPPGFEGNAFDRCERVECHTDSECPSNRACISQRCVDPCSQIANPPCAQNAICYAQNHAAGCICPPHLPEGSPMAYCSAPSRVAGRPECEFDVDCPSKLACIRNQCVNPCESLSPCHRTAHCSVLDTIPVRTMICTCPEGWVPNNEGECHAIVVPIPPGCTRDDDCSNNEACINRLCRNPCDCGSNAQCLIQNHRPICSCEEGYEGNPNIACRKIGCRIDSECESGKACINGHCINPCLVKDPCGINSECYVYQNRAECRCISGYRGNPFDRCIVEGCTSNSDCPSDRQCINAQCINPCVYDNPCSPRAECRVQNHMSLCRCPVGFLGNPYVDCRPEPEPECREDSECPSRLACLNEKCQNPCAVLEPCQRPSECQVVGSVPVRTMICVCPPGYISSGSGTCNPVTAIKEIGACVSDSECPSDKACFNGICRDPCNCGINSECRVKDHKPVCTCRQGYDGKPEIECHRIGCRSDDECSPQHQCINRQCVPACAADGSTCGDNAECYASNHRSICECPPGLMGDPKVSCVLVGCRSDTDCPESRACINQKCENPCTNANPCDAPAECKVFNHAVECACPPNTVSDGKMGCMEVDVKCRQDSECPSQYACIGGECVNPCKATEPCGVNAECTVLNTEPVRTMTCECLPGYQGNAAVQCDKMALCRTDKGYVRTSDGKCVCPPNSAQNDNDECIPCRVEKGFKIDERGRCVCALERGLIIDERGNCVCPIEFGYRLDSRGNCIPKQGPECKTDEDCADHKYCNPNTKTCDDPCETKHCGINALCNATNHRAICQCITGYTGDPELLCNHTSPFRTDFPRPEMQVSCLSDGVQLEIHITETGFNGVLYVKGHSKDEQCRRVVTLPPDSTQRLEIFKVQFGNCGLIHVNGQASFVLVIQKHPKLVTYKAQAYHIKCVYQTGEQNVTLGFNVSMLTTAGTIANTGPPPTCLMKIVTQTGQEINSAEIGDNLMLQVDVQPGSIYGGFARSCVAKTMEDNEVNEYLVTDENGCATDPTIFGEWEYNPDTQSLLASFNAFKFPSSDNIRFQCNIRVCFGKCQPVNCRGYNAFGRRKRAIDENNTDVAVSGDLLSGQLREEITISSNAILTFERREERFTNPTEAPNAQRVEDICVSKLGLIIALIVTALLALVAVAVAVSCWLMAYRRRPKATGPLPHPPEFPNPLFTTPEPISEPTPDYLT